MTRFRYSEIKTEFVKRELQRTRWKNRGYIDTLMLIEDIYVKGGPKQLSEGMWLSHITKKYPVAVHAIRSELVEGKTLSDEELRAWAEAKKREEERRHKEWEEEQKRRNQEELELERLGREEWIRMGGAAVRQPFRCQDTRDDHGDPRRPELPALSPGLPALTPAENVGVLAHQ